MHKFTKDELLKASVTIDELINEYKVSKNKEVVDALKTAVKLINNKLEEETPTNKSGQSSKTQHSWSKKVSEIIFSGEYRDGVGQCVWQTRKELVLLKGAKLAQEMTYTNDGSLNYSCAFAQDLRKNYTEFIENDLTTRDLVFPSPNILGMFLFNGGQNTWLVFKDENGKSLDEWTRKD